MIETKKIKLLSGGDYGISDNVVFPVEVESTSHTGWRFNGYRVKVSELTKVGFDCGELKPDDELYFYKKETEVINQKGNDNG